MILNVESGFVQSTGKKAVLKLTDDGGGTGIIAVKK